MVNHNLITFVVCPKCKGNLIFNQENKEFLCERCFITYKTHEGIPVLLSEEGFSYSVCDES